MDLNEAKQILNENGYLLEAWYGFEDNPHRGTIPKYDPDNRPIQPKFKHIIDIFKYYKLDFMVKDIFDIDNDGQINILFNRYAPSTFILKYFYDLNEEEKEKPIDLWYDIDSKELISYLSLKDTIIQIEKLCKLYIKYHHV